MHFFLGISQASVIFKESVAAILFLSANSGRVLEKGGEAYMKKALLVLGTMVSAFAAVFCVLRRRKKCYGSPC